MTGITRCPVLLEDNTWTSKFSIRPENALILRIQCSHSLMLLNVCDSAETSMTWPWQCPPPPKKKLNLILYGMRRWENSKLCIIFNFTRYLKVQCGSIFKTLPWSFSVKMHLYANYTLQCTPESVLLCTFPKLQKIVKGRLKDVWFENTFA